MTCVEWCSPAGRRLCVESPGAHQQTGALPHVARGGGAAPGRARYKCGGSAGGGPGASARPCPDTGSAPWGRQAVVGDLIATRWYDGWGLDGRLL